MKRIHLVISISIFANLFSPPLVFASDYDYLFPVKDCKVTYSRYHHDYPATDIFTKAGCIFIAPIAGEIDQVSRRDTWSGRINAGDTRGGKFVSMIGDDGIRYYGSHLRSVSKGIKKGKRVEAGEALGEIGSSGSARGTAVHLHFGISWPTAEYEGEYPWWIRRGLVNPYRYLKSWQSGKDLSPVKSVNDLKVKSGGVVKKPKE
ncbi:MAG: M23 family metallopeptidase [Actinobacteria bacterium]|nr:M23 family metallopeptidase [Actinomycetota bacterium]